MGLSDRQAIQRVLSERQNRYMVRQLCWVMTIEGLETYILTPRDPGYLEITSTTFRVPLRGDSRLSTARRDALRPKASAALA